jgi:hypothetical protein
MLLLQHVHGFRSFRTDSACPRPCKCDQHGLGLKASPSSVRISPSRILLDQKNIVISENRTREHGVYIFKARETRNRCTNEAF